MHPILQIRTDELAGLDRPLEGAALVTLWLDLDSETFWGARDGEAFTMRTYDSLDGLVPIGPGYRESDALPTFPVIWEAAIPGQPAWEDMSYRVPRRVAWAREDDWFFGSKTALACYGIRETHPVQIGGWPQWIQGAHWPKGGLFLFQIDSTQKGRMGFGDSGSIYLFRSSEGFEIRGDCY